MPQAAWSIRSWAVSDFYLFALPVWDLLAGWLVTLAVLSCILAALFLLVAGGGRALSGRLSSSVPLPWRGISVAAGFLLLAIAFRAYVGRFEMLFEHHTIFDGVSYTDAHMTLTGMLIVCVALVIGAIIAVVGGVMRPRGLWLAAAVAPAMSAMSTYRRMVRDHIPGPAQPA